MIDRIPTLVTSMEHYKVVGWLGREPIPKGSTRIDENLSERVREFLTFIYHLNTGGGR